KRGSITVAGTPQSGRSWAVSRLDALLRSHPREVNAALEEVLKRKASSASLETLAEEFPHPESVRSRLLGLAGQQEKAGRPGAAAQTYRQLLRLSQTAKDRNGDERVTVLAGLARVYKLQGATEAARGVLQSLFVETAWNHFFRGGNVGVVS